MLGKEDMARLIRQGQDASDKRAARLQATIDRLEVELSEAHQAIRELRALCPIWRKEPH